MTRVFDSSEFKKFLIEDGDRFKVDGLSLWVNKIPIPIDLFDDFFEEWRFYFKSYLDHIFASIILGNASVSPVHPELSIQKLPDKKVAEQYIEELSDFVKIELSEKDAYGYLAGKFSKILGVEDYELNLSALMDAFSHNGKKYDRLHLPKIFKDFVGRHFPNVLKHIAIKNGDMFGNIIVDDMGLYRGGFGDAMITIFNRLLDYKIEECSGFIGKINSVSLSFDDYDNSGLEDKLIIEKVRDGSLWEPIFDGTLKVKINPTHPYYKEINACGNPAVIYELLVKMSELEMNSMNSKELKILENIRIEISRALWMRNF